MFLLKIPPFFNIEFLIILEIQYLSEGGSKNSILNILDFSDCSSFSFWKWKDLFLLFYYNHTNKELFNSFLAGRMHKSNHRIQDFSLLLVCYVMFLQHMNRKRYKLSPGRAKIEGFIVMLASYIHNIYIFLIKRPCVATNYAVLNSQ